MTAETRPVANEAEKILKSGWKDPVVAGWAIKMLPLLEIGETRTACPVLSLSMQEGLSLESGNLDV
jgi:hypothetical protein